jgi:uncharacterized protein (TIGR02646 family)
MRTIHKGQEPASLARHRNSALADYGNYNDKDTLRVSLVTEQRGLCCYCLSQIRADGRAMKIAHWHSQDEHPAEQLDHRNLLGARKGNEGQPRKSQHCDTRQGNRDFSRNPADPMHRVEDLIRYEGDGRIASDNQGFDAELNDVLNLNAASLLNKRKAPLDAFVGALPRRSPLGRKALERWLQRWNGESYSGELEPFCMVVVYWLRKRLARA